MTCDWLKAGEATNWSTAVQITLYIVEWIISVITAGIILPALVATYIVLLELFLSQEIIYSPPYTIAFKIFSLFL